ncbi:MAG: type I restriction enzyme HsdR N-terminal domain-containing protein [Saprospiraceae bacterium]|nr:type I restriction enzyme HsdR N-terminal domain-containing protein [Saprospiraceae bacterium]
MNLEKYFTFLKRNEGKIFDPIRKKWFIETKEEIVRQLMLHYLIYELKYGSGRIAVEKRIKLGNTIKRFDIVIYDLHIQPMILIECKSYTLDIKESAIYQIARYNITLKAPYLCITNGLIQNCAYINFTDMKIEKIDSLPYCISG